MMLRNLRSRTFGKQVCLAQALKCTEAAVSLWESGRRVPTPKTLLRILESFADQGVGGTDLVALRKYWWMELLVRHSGE
jgi:transcriptional regulator with XRE-family HTH domain